jgi:hypothetical protein
MSSKKLRYYYEAKGEVACPQCKKPMVQDGSSLSCPGQGCKQGPISLGGLGGPEPISKNPNVFRMLGRNAQLKGQLNMGDEDDQEESILNITFNDLVEYLIPASGGRPLRPGEIVHHMGKNGELHKVVDASSSPTHIRAIDNKGNQVRIHKDQVVRPTPNRPRDLAMAWK